MEAPAILKVADRALIYNRDDDTWEEGWINIFRRRKAVTFLTNATVLAPNGSVKSPGKDYKAYNEAMILVRVGTVDPSTGIWVAVQTSMDGTTWYQEYAENSSFYGLRFDVNQSGGNYSFRTQAKGDFIRVRAYQIGSGLSVSMSVSGILM